MHAMLSRPSSVTKSYMPAITLVKDTMFQTLVTKSLLLHRSTASVPIYLCTDLLGRVAANCSDSASSCCPYGTTTSFDSGYEQGPCGGCDMHGSRSCLLQNHHRLLNYPVKPPFGYLLTKSFPIRRGVNIHRN